MKKFMTVALVLALALAFAVPAMAVPSYDSTVYVNITPDDPGIILNGDSVDVTFTVDVTNISKSGDLPQIVVTPLGDNTAGIAASALTKIANGNTAAFTFTVTYTEIGEYEFAVNIKNMQGNSGKWNYEFNSAPVTVSIIAPPEEEGIPEGFAFVDGGMTISKDALGIGDFDSNGKDIIVYFNGSAKDVNSQVNASNNGLKIKDKALLVGVYEIINTATGLTFKFEIIRLGDNAAIVIL